MLCKDGTEIRRFKDENSYDYEIQLQRYYCPCCKERYIEWPDCFEKGKVYLKNIMDKTDGMESIMSMWPNICPLLMFDELTEEERSEIVLKILSKFAEQEYDDDTKKHECAIEEYRKENS